jgi:hypothetical protein
MTDDEVEAILIQLFERYPKCPTPDQQPRIFYYHLKMFLYGEGYF